MEANIKLTDLIDLEFLQDFQDKFAKSTNVASIMVDSVGPITKPSNFTDFCIKYTRGSEEGYQRCNNCDIECGSIAAKNGAPVIYNCHSGLTDFAVPIMLGDTHIASILGGQILTNEPDEQKFRAVARELSIDEDEYIESLRQVKIIPFEQVQAAADLLFIVANTVSKMAEKNFELIKKNKIEKEIAEKEYILRKIVEKISSTLDFDTMLSFIGESVAKLFNVQKVIIMEYPNLGDYSDFTVKLEYASSEDITNLRDYEVAKKISKFWGENLSALDGISTYESIDSADVPDFVKNAYNSLGAKSAIAASIQKDNKKWGGLILFDYNQSRNWSEDEISLLKTISRQIYIVFKQSELYSKMQQQVEREKSILNNLPFIAWLKDKEGKYLNANEPYAAFCNMTVEKLLGKTDFDIFPINLAEKYKNDDFYVMTHKQQINVEEEIIPEKDLENTQNKRWYETYKTPFFNENGEVIGTTGFSRDITDRKEIDRMKNEFVSMVSHELRTPLTSIRGALGLVTGSNMAENLPEKIKELLNIANNNSIRLINLINDILDIEKIEAGKMDFDFEVAELIPIIEQSIQSNTQYAQKFNVDIRFENMIDNVKVRVDKSRLMQVLTNLLSNAIKFSDKNSSVRLSIFRLDNSIRVSVTNSGKEISEEFRSKIFQKFAQADSSDSRQKGGTGLGLNIARAIIERMSGHVDFVSQNNETTFFFDLPEFIECEPVISQRLDSNQPNILICEDNKDVALLISMLLAKENYLTDIAYSAEQAKKLLSQRDYDAMTLDLILPDEDGISLIKEIRENKNTENLPIIVISIIAKEGAQELDGHFAVIDWIDKPIKSDRLLTALKLALCTNTTDKPKILHVEDDLDVQKITYSILENDAYISQVANLKDAKEVLEKEEFDLLLLDLELPDGNGSELLSLLNKNEDKKIMTVIFSAHNVGKDIAKQVDAVLLKSNTSNEDLLKIVHLIKQKKTI